MKRVARDGRSASVGTSLVERGLAAGLSVAIAVIAPASIAFANPEGGQVVQGAATITTPTPATTQVKQSSDKAIIDWKSFNIKAGESTIFSQPDSSSVTLNRIFDQDPSIIAGLLSANGRLVLINANGLVFENGASVNTAGLIATTADIRNDDFMAGRYRFETPGNPQAQIVNKGMISAEEGGVVAFVAPAVRNSGVITAKLGRVVLGAGKTFVLDLYGDNLISFPISAEIAEQLIGADGKPLASLIEHSGKIEAGSVQLTARAARGLIDNVINVDGEIIASGVVASDNGAAVKFMGSPLPEQFAEVAGVGSVFGRYGAAIVVDGGQGGVRLAGALDASGAQGGSIAVSGSRVELRGSVRAVGSEAKGGDVSIGGKAINLHDAVVDVSGATGGGSIAIGFTGGGAARSINAETIVATRGTALRADALDSGDGGSIEFWSTLATDFRGMLSARGGAASGDGGFLEVSSKGDVGFWGTADASAANGQSGTLLLDPKNIIISTAGIGLGLPGLTDPNQLTFGESPSATLTVNPDSITATLNTGTAVRLQANNDLTVASDIIADRNFGDAGPLTLQAGRSVFINADIVTDDGDLTIIANEVLAAGVVNAQRDPGNAVLSMGVGASINAGSGNVRLTIASGAGKTFGESGDMTLRDIAAGRIIAENLGPSNGDVIVESGVLSATNTGSAIVLASAGGDFINNAGAASLNASEGRWIVYSQTPLASVRGGLAGTPYYNAAYDPANPTDFPADDNRFAYTIAPVLAIKADDVTREYGDFNPDFTFSITGFIAGDDPALATEGDASISTTANELSPAGVYAIDVGLQTLTSDYNYGFLLIDGVLTISPAQLFYQAFGVTREYGEPNPDLDGEFIGLRLNDTEADVVTGTAIFTTAAGPTANVGDHAIDGTGLTVINPNYQLTILQAPGNATALTVTPAELTYVADEITREYGDPNNLTGTVIGLKNGELLSSVTSGTLVFLSSATPTSPVGIYESLGGGLTVTSPNYVPIILQDPENFSALTVTLAQLVYVADPKRKTYGEVNPVFTGTVAGLKNGDTLEAVTDGTLVWTSGGSDFSDAGIYFIEGGGLTVTSGNYFVDIEQAPGNESAFTIDQAQLIYVADKKSRIYSFPDPEFTGTVLGLTNDDDLDNAADGDLVFTTTTTSTTPAGFYAITGGGLTVSSPNYISTILQDPGNATAFEIIAIPLTTSQAMSESMNANSSALDQPQETMSSRNNELNVGGVAPPGLSGADADPVAQLCVLGAAEAANAPGCSSRKSP